MNLKELLTNEGIACSLKPGVHLVDCPKPYCKSARIDSDKTCLSLQIVGRTYAHWKCRNCLWTGHAGTKPEELDNTPRSDNVIVSTKLPAFYGIDNIDPKNRSLILTQRDSDRLLLEGFKFTNVLALPVSGKMDFAAHADIFQKANRIVIAFDNTLDGDKLRHEVVRRVGAAKSWNVKFYRGTAEATLKQDGEDFVCADINEATAHPIKGLYQVEDFMNEVITYYDGGMAAGVSTGWANVDTLYTVLPGQFTVVTGIPNSGKSTWLDALTVNLAINHNWVFGVFSPENPKALHTIKLAQKRVGMPADPKHKDRMSRETLMAGASWVSQYFKFIVSDSMEEPPTLEWILARASDAVLRFGIKGLVIDPWNRIVKKYESGQNESAYVETALAHILRFALNHDVHVWLVAHPTKQEPDKKTGNFGVPSLYSISGGANFPNMMDNGIVIYRPAGADNAHVTEVWVRKIRFDHVGQTGHTNLKYDKDTGNFSVLDEPVATYLFGDPDEDEGAIKTYEPI